MQLDTITKYPYLHSGKTYIASDERLMAEQRECLRYMDEFNATGALELERRSELLPKMFASVGKNCFVEAPVSMNFGGNHVYLGDNVYINFNFCAVDDTFIRIGDGTMIGPNVTIATAMHPENPEFRAKGAQYNLPVTIGKNVWIAANVTICPGVTIGDNCVIGAGAVVTRDIPANSLACGVPCKVIREIDLAGTKNPEFVEQ